MPRINMANHGKTNTEDGGQQGSGRLSRARTARGDRRASFSHWVVELSFERRADEKHSDGGRRGSRGPPCLRCPPCWGRWRASLSQPSALPSAAWYSNLDDKGGIERFDRLHTEITALIADDPRAGNSVVDTVVSMPMDPPTGLQWSREASSSSACKFQPSWLSSKHCWCRVRPASDTGAPCYDSHHDLPVR